MINIAIRKVLNDYVAFIDGFKHQFSPEMEEFEQRSRRSRSGHIGGFNYQFHGAGCRLEKTVLYVNLILCLPMNIP
ncbi:hypothetical protein [Sphingobacterium sp.]|uniref:DUF6896 domain-containing protein n=1 Tax=Sphingobacterium sp. TaxID=341027 RepID=UPI0031DC2036